MNKHDALSIVETHLTKKRFDHTVRVAETAVELAAIYQVSAEKAEMAAIFHDYCKYRSLEEMQRIIETTTLPKDLLLYHHELWHGPVASIKVEEEYGITDEEIKSAIYCHTTGKAFMSKLDLIIFVADYIEPGRNFPGLDEVREMATTDLIKTAWMISRNTINFLMEKKNRIYPDTFHAYNDLTRLLDGGNHIEQNAIGNIETSS